MSDGTTDLDGPSRDRERLRIEQVYEGYDGQKGRWAGSNRGNQLISEQRDRALVDALRRRGLWPLGPAAVLDLGCGGGGLLDLLATGGGPHGVIIGADLRVGRLQEVRGSHAHASLVGASGAALPHPAGSLDLVIVTTVFSSVLDPQIQRGIAAEITRVLRPGGTLLWYDMRIPNPENRAIRPLSKRDIRSLFPEWAIDLRSITLLPPVARRLAVRPDRAYRLLHAVPFLRSHLLGTLARPSAP